MSVVGVFGPSVSLRCLALPMDKHASLPWAGDLLLYGLPDLSHLESELLKKGVKVYGLCNGYLHCHIPSDMIHSASGIPHPYPWTFYPLEEDTSVYQTGLPTCDLSLQACLSWIGQLVKPETPTMSLLLSSKPFHVLGVRPTHP